MLMILMHLDGYIKTRVQYLVTAYAQKSACPRSCVPWFIVFPQI